MDEWKNAYNANLDVSNWVFFEPQNMPGPTTLDVVRSLFGFALVVSVATGAMQSLGVRF